MANLNRRRIIGWGVFIAALFLIEFVPLLHRPLAPFIRAGAYLEGGLYRVTNSARKGLEHFVIGQDISSRIAELESRLAIVTMDQARLASLQEENRDFRNLLNFQESRSLSTIATRVIGEDPRSLAELRLAAGSRAGVRSGAAVISPDGVLVGIIADVGPETSIARLLKHRSTQLPVRVSDKPQAFGLLESTGGLSLRMTQIPKDVDIKPGDIIITSYANAEVPANLAVGTILTVANDPQGLWQEATIAPLIKPATLDIVAIVTVL